MPTTLATGKAHVIAISLITAACLFGDSMLYIVLPVHYQEAGLTSLWEVGVILSMNRLIRLPLNPVVGWMYRRISVRGGILLATALAAASTLGYAFADSFFIWIFLRSVWGLSWTLLRIGGFFCILEISDNNSRGYFMGLYNGLYRLGSLVGMLAGGILADTLGFFATTLLFGTCSAMALPPALFTLPNGKIPPSPTKNDPLAPPLFRQNKKNVLLIMGTGLVAALAYQGLYAATLTQMIYLHLGAVVTLCGLALGAASLGGLLQALRWGWEPWLAPWFGKLSDLRFGRTPMMIWALLGAALLFGLTALSLPALLWCLVLLGVELFGTLQTTLADAVASDAATRRARDAQSELAGRDFMRMYSLAVDLGAALGPFTAYAVSEILDMNAAYLFVAVLMAVLGVAWLKTGAEGFDKTPRVRS